MVVVEGILAAEDTSAGEPTLAEVISAAAAGSGTPAVTEAASATGIPTAALTAATSVRRTGSAAAFRCRCRLLAAGNEQHEADKTKRSVWVFAPKARST